MTFRHGELFERSFQAAGGEVEVLAEVVVDGHRLELRDIAIYPRGPRGGRTDHPARLGEGGGR